MAGFGDYRGMTLKYNTQRAGYMALVAVVSVQFDSDYSVGDDPPHFFFQVCGICIHRGMGYY
jgi:hypothetical protein